MLEDSLPPDWQARVDGELEPGERLVWTGRPLTGTFGMAFKRTWFVSLFGCFWLAMVTGFFFFITAQEGSSRKWDEDHARFVDKNFTGEFFREAREREAR